MVIYGCLYVTLRSEQHALVLGSVLLFGALATAMILTRKLDWYALAGRLAPAGYDATDATPEDRRGGART